jgi:kynurenine formamidase
MRRLVDLSMPVHADMVTFPRVPAPSLLVNETHAEFAERIGAAEYGVLLDFTSAEPGHVIGADEIEAELDRIGYAVKERDIVLIHTGAGAYNNEERYKTDHPGMSAAATRWLIERGVRMMGSTRSRSTRRCGRCSRSGCSGRRTASCGTRSTGTSRTS